MEHLDTLIIGAGALGLACAARLAGHGRSLLIAEAENRIGSHTSSRNSEVIHAGLYYPPGSLKAELCLEGRERLYAWCARHGVGHRRIGKLLVAVHEDECARLEGLQANAAACGLHELQPLDRDQLRRLEPEVKAVAGLLSPHTGILDSHAYLQSLLAATERQGGQLALATRIERLEPHPDGWLVSGTSAGEPFQILADEVINAAGLDAQALAARIPGLPAAAVPRLHLCQGRYFSYSGRSPFQHLIYPMPEANTAGLGIHATLDLGGQLRFGPDVHYLESGSTTASTRPCAPPSPRRSAATGRGWTPTAWSPPTAACAPSCPVRVNRRRISSSKPLHNTGWSVSSTCSASSRRG